METSRKALWILLCFAVGIVFLTLAYATSENATWFGVSNRWRNTAETQEPPPPPETVPVDPSAKLDAHLEIEVPFIVTETRPYPGVAGRYLVADKAGSLHLWDRSTALLTKWLDVPDEVISGEAEPGLEQGLLSFAFHPEFPRDPRLFVLYVSPLPGGEQFPFELRLVEWTLRLNGFSSSHSTTIHRTRVLIRLGQVSEYHCGGQIRFGPQDGFLYASLGENTRRDQVIDLTSPKAAVPLTHPYGTVVRLDINRSSHSAPYAIPSGNRFRNNRALSEIWAFGFRQPWRIFFDSQGTLYSVDVGQDSWEKLTRVQGGAFHGWPAYEGNQCIRPASCHYVREEPRFVYGRKLGASIIGGMEYQGAQFSSLRSHLLVGDFVSGNLWALAPENGQHQDRLIGTLPFMPMFIEPDENGEPLFGGYSPRGIYSLSTLRSSLLSGE